MYTDIYFLKVRHNLPWFNHPMNLWAVDDATSDDVGTCAQRTLEDS